jgi:cell division protein ZapE
MDVLAATPDLEPDPSRGPLPTYRARVNAGRYAPDPAQAMIAENLQELWFRLRGYAPRPAAAAAAGGLLARLFRKRASEDGAAHAPIGLYIVGQVGRGKSMLMDLFFEAADVARKGGLPEGVQMLRKPIDLGWLHGYFHALLSLRQLSQRQGQDTETV